MIMRHVSIATHTRARRLTDLNWLNYAKQSKVSGFTIALLKTIAIKLPAFVLYENPACEMNMSRRFRNANYPFRFVTPSELEGTEC